MEEKLILRNLIFLLLNTIILTQCTKYIINEKRCFSIWFSSCVYIHSLYQNVSEINNNRYLFSSLIISSWLARRIPPTERHNYLHVRGQKNGCISVPSAILDFFFSFYNISKIKIIESVRFF